ncbi:MAG: hypothetical protein ABI866_06520 [Dokdonella sp.]
MSGRVERTLRVIRDGEGLPKPVAYWRTRSYEERLTATLELHREGNELFRGGNLPFAHVFRIRHVPPLR